MPPRMSRYEWVPVCIACADAVALRAAADVGRTLKARSAVIREVHDSLHELGVYAPDASGDHKAFLER